jgi:hypothetical protein
LPPGEQAVPGPPDHRRPARTPDQRDPAAAGSENEIIERFPVVLADVVGHVVAQTAPEAKQPRITLHQEALTDGDALLLEWLVQNPALCGG